MPRATNRDNDEDENDPNQLLRETQLESSEKDKRIARLERRLADLTNQGATPSPPRNDDDEEENDNPRPSKKSRARPHRDLSADSVQVERPAKRTHTDAADNAHHNSGHPAPSHAGAPSWDQVATLGARFVTTRCPWLVHDDVISASPNPAWDPATRYDKDGEEFIEENIFQGQLRDLLELVPQEYHSYRGTTAFIDAFKYGMQRRRQQYARRVRVVGKEKIFGYEWAAHMRTAESRREHFAKLIGFKPAQGTKKSRYSVLNVPLLHSSECEKYKFSDAFTHIRLQAVLVSLLRGEGGAEDFMNGSRTFKLSGKEIQSKDRVRSMTPNLIATPTIIAKWALSEDGDFTRTGVSGIDWLDHWNEYMLVLETALEDKRCQRTIRKLFRNWDEAVFGSKNSPLGGDGDDDLTERSNELDDALKQIDDEEYEFE
ncbi:hypothetical protein EXIGLDRAFT_756584 [Exidia glandulosa HHB12029]|uniref:Uncharacterized protein n=1 Tax=Exidia glandulosa HHB12029 TaxID=1314781 RepID=A0A165Z6Z4_EXIGL|nr:hypothetical protein EXIGLDRAFT_756584 [Exidia glandulosa HHB12029]